MPPPPPPPPPPPIIIEKFVELPPIEVIKYIEKPVVKEVEVTKVVEKPVVTYVDKVVEKPVVEYVDKPVVVEKVVERIIEKETGMTSLRIKAEKEKELTEAEAYWSKRFAKQEQEHSSLAHLEVATMNETAERLSKAFSIQKFPPTCISQRDDMLQCYKQNPDKILLCSEVGKDFRAELLNKFTFSSDKTSVRARLVAEVLPLPGAGRRAEGHRCCARQPPAVAL